MKIKLLSDIHLEFLDNPVERLEKIYASIEDSEDTILILAGDIITLNHTDIMQVLKFFCDKYKYVFYIPGNHEFYGYSLIKGMDFYNTLESMFNNLYTPYHKIIELDGRRWLGGTLWFGSGYSTSLERGMNDFRCIDDFKPNVFIENSKFIKFVEDNLQENDIVISHYLPSVSCVASRFIGEPLNHFYVCDLTKLIEERKPSYWFHGHTHDSVDVRVSETQIIANPVDYPPYWNNRTALKFERIIEI